MKSAAVIVDAEWTLVWVSSEMQWAMGAGEAQLGVGRHLLECYLMDAWCQKITEQSRMRGFVEEVPHMIHDTPGGKTRIIEIIRARAQEGTSPLGTTLSDEEREQIASEIEKLVEQMEVTPPPAMWYSSVEWIHGDLAPLTVNFSVTRLHDYDGTLRGMLMHFHSALPGRVLALVARGDQGMLERMARLFDPGPRQAAILFSDLQMSGALSRKLPSAAYFQLVRAITTAIDDVVIRHRGIVGKHAGDGVSAFFLADDLGSSSGAARAAIEAARDIAVAAHDSAKEIGEETGLFDSSDCLVNVGVHWGGHLFMGQLVTNGRLEVTALGDRVNECARIEGSATDGQALASKSLIEHLSGDDASAVGIDPHGVLYRALEQLPGADAKAVRDAGQLPVTVL
ncbi:MAG: adenylate/guanylate cyclase domain-containing protein [Actinomycetota bacterium]